MACAMGMVSAAPTPKTTAPTMRDIASETPPARPSMTANWPASEPPRMPSVTRMAATTISKSTISVPTCRKASTSPAREPPIAAATALCNMLVESVAATTTSPQAARNAILSKACASIPARPEIAPHWLSRKARAMPMASTADIIAAATAQPSRTRLSTLASPQDRSSRIEQRQVHDSARRVQKRPAASHRTAARPRWATARPRAGRRRPAASAGAA